jgi:hypothetical protein
LDNHQNPDNDDFEWPEEVNMRSSTCATGQNKKFDILLYSDQFPGSGMKGRYHNKGLRDLHEYNLRV